MSAGPSELVPALPLAGVRVVDVSTILAGPLCCQVLGDFGADVVKVELPGAGDGLRGHGRAKDGVGLWWKEVGRNKRTVAVDLRQADGAEIFRRLAVWADVVVESFRPGTLERWGLGPDQLREDHPELIVVRLSGFGQTGPYAGRPGFGTLAEAMSGFAYMTGEEDGPPTLPAFGLADTICGIAASSATLMALRHREVQGGPGQVVDISILAPMMTAVGPAPTVFHQLGEVLGRHGNRSDNNAPRNTYRTRDGSWVAVSSSATRIAERVMRLVGHPEVADEPWFSSGRGRAAHADLIDGYVSAWIGERDRDEVLEAFERAEAAIAPVYSGADLVADPHVRATGMLTEVADEDFGDLLMHNVMWNLSGSPGRIRFTGRPVGADTEDVLVGELGLDPSRVQALRAAGVVA